MKKYFMLLCVVAMVLFIAQMNYAQNKSSIDATNSLDVICQDSIQEAQIESEDEQKAARLYEINKQLTFENFLEMMENYASEEYAQKCGLSFVYKDKNECGEKYVYGRGVEKGKKNDCGYDIESKSDNACYLEYSIDNYGTPMALLCFKDSDDADYFFKRANEYGLLIYNSILFVPKNKLPNGSREKEDSDKSRFAINEPRLYVGWHTVWFDF